MPARGAAAAWSFRNLRTSARNDSYLGPYSRSMAPLWHPLDVFVLVDRLEKDRRRRVVGAAGPAGDPLGLRQPRARDRFLDDDARVVEGLEQGLPERAAAALPPERGGALEVDGELHQHDG